MSVMILSAAHINALVTWANHHSVAPRLPAACVDDPQLVGRLIQAANLLSFARRYEGRHKFDGPEFIWRPDTAKTLTAIEALKATQCAIYNCDDMPDFETSNVCRVLHNFKSTAISMLPGYDDAAWGIK